MSNRQKEIKYFLIYTVILKKLISCIELIIAAETKAHTCLPVELTDSPFFIQPMRWISNVPYHIQKGC